MRVTSKRDVAGTGYKRRRTSEKILSSTGGFLRPHAGTQTNTQSGKKKSEDLEGKAEIYSSNESDWGVWTMTKSEQNKHITFRNTAFGGLIAQKVKCMKRADPKTHDHPI